MSQPTCKVFVGNLSFKTKASELAAEFSSAGKVIGANIISRGPRSLGYGFVEMETQEEASKAVSLLNKKPIDNREINVEIAKPRDETKRPERPERSFDGGRPPRRRGGRGGRGGRGPRRGRGRGARNSANVEVGAQDPEQQQPPQQQQQQQQVSSPAPSSSPAQNNNAEGQNGPPARRRYNNNNNNNKSFPRSGGARGGGGRGGSRGRFPRHPNPNRTPSSTTLFVANLPFSLVDEGLLELFKDHHPVKAHVVLNRNGRSKGFGFVEFSNQEDQTAAFSAEKKTVDNRELIVKIALTSEPKTEGTLVQESPTPETKPN